MRISTVRCRANQKQFARGAGTSMNKALDGINLVEFDSNLGAAYAAMLLAEQGARAVKVEPPGGARDAAPRISMRSIAASARSSSTFKPSGRASSGCSDGPTSRCSDGPGRGCASSDSITRRFAESIRIWWCLHVPPLGNRGPARQFRRQRRTGLRARRHLRQPVGAQRKSGGACISPPPAIRRACSARPRRSRRSCARDWDSSGQSRGQLVEVSLLAGAFSLQTGGIMRHEKMTRMYEGPLDPLGPIPCYRLFRAADGEYLFVACGNVTFWNKLALAIERPELVSDPRFEGAPWGVPSAHRQALKDLLAGESFATPPARRMDPHPARERHPMRTRDLAHGIHRPSAGRRARDAPRDRRSHTRRDDPAWHRGRARTHARRNRRSGAGN